MTRAHDHIAAMALYALAEISAPPGKPLISLSQNESLRPPSPSAIAAATQALLDGALYPDPDWTALRHALANLHSIDAAHILCGTGSLDLIGCLMRVFTGPDRPVLVPAHAYPFFRVAAQMAGARCELAAETACTVDVDALLAGVCADTAMVCVANPGNPTGTRIPRSELLRLRAGLREDILLVVDEAYGEFADDLNERNFDMVNDGNTLVLRTFSKAYGLAGFRVGWGLFPAEIAAQMRKVMNPNNISAPAQAAAVAALADQSYMVGTVALTAELRDAATQKLTGAGLTVLPSFTNFLLINLTTPARAQAADAALRAEGIILRGQGGAGLPHMLRLTIGPHSAMDAAVEHLIAWEQTS